MNKSMNFKTLHDGKYDVDSRFDDNYILVKFNGK